MIFLKNIQVRSSIAIPLFRVLCIALIAMFFCPGLVTAKTPGEYQTLQVFFENDLFGNTDKYYTNAVQATWLSKDLAQYKNDVRLPHWALPVIHRIPFANEPGSVHNVGLILGQHIYTPSDIGTGLLLKNDRPYAGFLYGGLALHSKTATRLDTIEIGFGIHLFIGTGLEGIARNIFLDGNTWQNSHSVHKKFLVADFSVGCALSFETVKLTYRNLFRTREFDNQD